MKRNVFLLWLAVIVLCSMATQAQIITTVAGSRGTGFSGDGRAATLAELSAHSIAFDGLGNMYIADYSNGRIRKIDTAGIISTIAGTGTSGYSGDGGAATSAEFYVGGPYGVAVDNSGNIFIADAGNSCIRKVNTSGIISTYAGTGTQGYSGDGGAATAAQLCSPFGIAVDKYDNIYIADTYNHCIRKINTSGTISTIAGVFIMDYTGSVYGGYSGDGGAATAARLRSPHGVTVDNLNNVYIADVDNHCVRKIDTAGIISTIAGVFSISFTGTIYGGYSGDGGAATSAHLSVPVGVAVDKSGNVYITDNGNQRIRKINSAGIISTVVGNGASGYDGDGGVATAASLYNPYGIAVDNFKNLYIADFIRIRKVSACTLASSGSLSGTSSLTPGATTTLTKTATGGTWSSSNNTIASVSSTGVVKGRAIGNVTISYTVTNTCGSTYATKSITVGATSRPVFTEGATTTLNACQNYPASGIALLLKAADADSGQTLRWKRYSAPVHGKAVVSATAISNKSTVTPTGTLNYTPDTGYSGTDSFKVQVSDGTDSSRITVYVNIRPLLVGEATISGPSEICYGAGTITLTPSVSGGNFTRTCSYIGVTSAGVVTATGGAGNAFVIYNFTGSNGCSARSFHNIKVVYPVSAAHITGATALCEGATAMWAHTLYPGGTWSVSAPAIASVSAAGSVTATGAGTAIISYTLTNSCSTKTVNRKVTITANPATLSITGGTGTLTVGGSTTLTGSIPKGTWSHSTLTVASLSSTGVVRGRAAGTDYITYSVTNSCGTGTAVRAISVSALRGAFETNGSEEVTAALKVYPNPANGIIHIEGQQAITRIAVTDISGKTVYETTAGSNTIQVDLSNYAAGVYLIKVQHEDGSVHEIKAVKE